MMEERVGGGCGGAERKGKGSKEQKKEFKTT